MIKGKSVERIELNITPESRIPRLHSSLINSLTEWRKLLLNRTSITFESPLTKRIEALIIRFRKESLQKFSSPKKESLEELKNLLHERKAKELPPSEKELIRKVERKLRTLEELTEKAYKIIPETKIPDLLRLDLLRNRSGIILGPKAQSRLFTRPEKLISLDPLIKNHRLNLPKVRFIHEETKIESKSFALEVFLRVLSTIFSEKLWQKLNHAQEKSRELMEKEIKEAIEELKEELRFLVFEGKLKTKPHPKVVDKEKLRALRGEELEEEPEEVSREKPTTSGTEKIVYRIVYDRKGNVIRVEIILRMQEEEPCTRAQFETEISKISKAAA